MKFFLVFFLTALTVSALDYCAIWKTVQPGNTCWQIVKDNGVHFKLEYLLSYNPGLNCNKLQVGDRICVARTGFLLQCKKEHKIAPGDTCFKIWTSNGISQREFVDWNQDVDCNHLEVGKRVCLGRL